MEHHTVCAPSSMQLEFRLHKSSQRKSQERELSLGVASAKKRTAFKKWACFSPLATKKTAHYNLIECQEHLCFHPICFTALIHQQRASTCQPTASTVNRKKQSDCTLQPNGSPSTLPAAKDGLRLQEATQRCQKLR